MPAADYGTQKPKMTGALLIQAGGGGRKRWEIPLHEYDLINASNLAKEASINFDDITLGSGANTEYFTALQAVRSATDNGVGRGSFTGAINRRPQRLDQFNTFDCFTLSARIDDFMTIFNTHKNTLTNTSKNKRDLQDVAITRTGSQLNIVLVADGGNWHQAWADPAKEAEIKTFFNTANPNFGNKSVAQHLNEILSIALDYLPALYSQNNWKRSSDNDPDVGLYSAGNLLRSALNPQSPKFDKFLSDYRELRNGLNNLLPADFREKFQAAFKDLKSSTVTAVGIAAMSAEAADRFSQLTEEAFNRVEGMGGNPEATDLLIEKSKLVTAYSPKSSTTLQNLVERFAKRVKQLHAQYGGFAGLPGGAAVGATTDPLANIPAGQQNTMIYKVRDSAEWLQKQINDDLPSYGDVFKSIMSIPEADWAQFGREIFPKEFALSFTVEKRLAGFERIRTSVTRPHNFRSWQHADHGDHIALVDKSATPDEVIHGVYKTSGALAVATPAGKDFTFESNVSKRYGKKEFVLHFLNNALGDTTMLSKELDVDFTHELEEETLTVVQLVQKALTPLTFEASVHIAPIYRDAAYAGLLTAIDSRVHKEGASVESGVIVNFDAANNVQQTVDVVVPETGNWVLSARYRTKSSTGAYQVSAPTAATPPAVVAAPAAVTRVDRAATGPDHLDEAGQSQTIVDDREHDLGRTALAVQGIQAQIDGHMFDIDALLKDPANHHGNNVTQALTASAKAQKEALEERLKNLRADVEHEQARANISSRQQANAVTERESSLQMRQQEQTRSVLTDIRDAVQRDPTTINDYFKVLQRRSYNLPLNDGLKPVRDFKALPESDQVFAVSHRDKLRMFFEKGSIDRSEEVTAPEFITILQAAITSHTPGALKQAETSYQAPSRSFLKTKTRGIGKPFMKRNAGRLRLRLA